MISYVIEYVYYVIDCQHRRILGVARTSAGVDTIIERFQRGTGHVFGIARDRIDCERYDVARVSHIAVSEHTTEEK